MVAIIGATLIFFGGWIALTFAVVQLNGTFHFSPFTLLAGMIFSFLFSAFAAVMSFRSSLKANTKAPKAEPVKVTCSHCGESVIATDEKCPMCGKALDATAAAQ